MADELCVRLLEARARVRFRPSGGYLWRTRSSAAPLSSADAFRRHGLGLMTRALEDGQGRAEIPGQGGRRFRGRLRNTYWFPLIPVLGPAWTVVLVRRGIAGLPHRDGLLPLIGATLPTAAFTGVTWAWLAFRLPPGGLAARLVVALPAAGTATFLVLIPWHVFVQLAAWGRDTATSGTTKT